MKSLLTLAIRFFPVAACCRSCFSEKRFCKISCWSLFLAWNWSVVTSAQLAPSYKPGHIHTDHPTTWHGSGPDFWKRVSIQGPGHEEPVIVHEIANVDRLYGQFFYNSTCQDDNITISETRKRTHSVTLSAEEQVGVAVDLAAAALLFAKLKATAHAQVTFNQEYSSTHEETISITSERAIHPCQKLYFHAWKTKYEAYGSMTFFSHKITCQCALHQGTEVNYCDEFVMTGWGQGFDGYGREWVQRGLVNPCACTNVAEGTEIVFEASGPLEVPPETNSGTGG